MGDGFLDDGLPALTRPCPRPAIARSSSTPAVRSPRSIPAAASACRSFREDPLDLDAYAAMLAAHLGRLDVVVGVESGDFL